MSEFEQKLKAAIARGQRTGDAREMEKIQAKLTADEIRLQHTKFRLAFSERIESSLKALVNQLPGFEYETVYGERGWGGAVARDELNIQRGKRRNVYSRLEVTVKPLSDLAIVDVVAKGTIKNREIFTRQLYREIAKVEETDFLDAIDRWVLEFAQMYCAADV